MQVVFKHIYAVMLSLKKIIFNVTLTLEETDKLNSDKMRASYMSAWNHK